MSRFYSRYLLLFVFACLLLALAACAPTVFPAFMCPTATFSAPVICPTAAPTGGVGPTEITAEPPTPKPSTPEPPLSTDWGVAVSVQAAGGSDLKLFEVTDQMWYYDKFDRFDGAIQGDTEGRVLLALEESKAISGTYVLYTALPITDAQTWYEYAWFAAESVGEVPEIALGSGLPISRTVSFTPDESDTILGDSYLHLADVGWDKSQVRRLLVQTGPGKYRLAFTECLPGDTCDGSSVPPDAPCRWCRKFGFRFCKRWC